MLAPPYVLKCGSLYNNVLTHVGKEYATDAEEKLRKEIFKESLEAVEEHNKLYEQGLIGYYLRINKYADLVSHLNSTHNFDQEILV